MASWRTTILSGAHRRFGIAGVFLTAGLLCAVSTERAAAQTVILKDAFPNLTFPGPVDFQHAGDGTNRVFVVRQAGYIMAVQNTPAATSAKTFLDIDALVESGGERGLLGLAFHPSYESNGYFYVNYTAASPLRTVVSRFSVSAANPDSADPASELVLLEIPQPYTNHNGGQLAFGPDGFLYIAAGDGGSGGDPGNRAQDRTTLLGKILRIDVDAPSDTLEYSIPSDNPYAGNAGGYREEIFAYGLRNPWRFSFDPVTGTGWVGDVGQGDWEEVDILASGGNYGWRLKEGDHCYDPPAGCDTIPGLIDPVWEYAHDAAGGCSITGGYVYRGAAIPPLAGKYLFGDYCSGRIWSLDSAGPGQWAASLVLDSTRTIMSFGIDRDGEVYVCSGGDGKIYRLTAVHPPAPSPLSPGDGAIDVPPDPELRWSPSPSAIRYHLQVAADGGFTALLLSDTALTDTARVFPSGPGPSTYFWRVRARNDVGWSPFSEARSFTTAGEGGLSVGYGGGWHIVALPLATPEGAVVSVFPAAISGVYSYDPGAGYSSRDTLLPGEGYWVKFADPQLVSFTGDPRTADTLTVLAGWNLIGGLSAPVDVDSVGTSPPGIIASGWFGYDGSYVAASALDPGRGYWVKFSAPGEIVLRAGVGAGQGPGR